MSLAASLKRYEPCISLLKSRATDFVSSVPCLTSTPVFPSHTDAYHVFSVLPEPNTGGGRVRVTTEENPSSGPSAALIKRLKEHSSLIPGYGERDDWVPRTAEDFGDGGAFPEVHVAQFPLEMGRNVQKALIGRTQGALVPLTTDADGRTRYDAVVMQGHGAGAVVHTRPSALVGRRYTDEELERPNEENVADTVERTRRAIQQRMSSILVETNASRPSESLGRASEPQLVRYSAAASSDAHAAGASQRLVKIVEKKADPLEPAKFKVQKTATLLETEAPVPVLHDAPKKLSKQEADAWAIPVAFSNWNSRGFTIGLDKREIATASAGQDTTISSKFATMAAALDTAQQSAREQVAYRARLEQQRQLQQRELEDQQAREVARVARLKRAGIYAEAEATETEEERQARRARDAVREEMRRDREDETRRERMGSRTKATAAAAVAPSRSYGERDISERIALGDAVPRAQEALFDSRMFNQTQGLDHGFVNEEEYNLYDKPLLSTGREEALFRSANQREGEIFQEEFSMEKLQKDSRFQVDKPFSGAERPSGSKSSQSRTGPVQFERDEDAAHQQRMEEIERQKSMVQQSRAREGDSSSYPSPPRRSSERFGGPQSSSSSPPRRGEGGGNSPSRRRQYSPPTHPSSSSSSSSAAASHYPSPPRRRDSGYPSPPRRRQDSSPPRGSQQGPADPMDSMLSFMSDAKSGRKRDRDFGDDRQHGGGDGGRGPHVGHMYAVAGSSGSVEDYRDSKRSKVSFVPTRIEHVPHEIREDARRRDAESERFASDQRPGGSYDRREYHSPPSRSRNGEHREYGSDRRFEQDRRYQGREVDRRHPPSGPQDEFGRDRRS